MTKATFETPEGDDVEVDSDDVISIRAGEDEDTVAIELDDGSEVTVVSTALEVAAELGLDPFEGIDEDDDESDDPDADDRDED